MGNVSERDIILFTVEFVNKVCEINKELIIEDYEYFIRFGKRILMLYDVLEMDCTVDEIDEIEDFIKHSFVPSEIDVREFTDDHECIAYLGCEGILYEKLYGYDGWQKDIFGDGDEAKRLYHALFQIADKYGLAFTWNSGALKFYDTEKFGRS